MISRTDNTTQSAFTLIELLVVIGIIGILASVIITNVTGARPKAQNASAFATLKSAQSVGIFCMDAGNDLNTPNPASPICDGQRDWPNLAGVGWAYADAGACAFDGDVSDRTFTYCATNGTRVIQCTDETCSQS